MDEERKERIGRTWADVVVALPRYLIVLMLMLIVVMIARAEFSEGVTKFGFLGDWGKETAEPPSADDAILGANAKLNRQLRCAKLSLKDVPSRIDDWKTYMEVTAETSSNPSLRQSRTATWKAEVDDVLRQINTTQQYISGERNNC